MLRRFRQLENWWRGYRVELSVDFYSQVHDLLNHEEVLKLDDFVQHHHYTRLQHSLNVAYRSYCITSFLGWDSRSTARAGLLHDFFLYDWRDADYEKRNKNHAMDHPTIALENARKITVLNKKEENIILRHMWLITAVPPRYKEGFVVTFVDKYCAMQEFLTGVFSSNKTLRSVFTV